MNWPGFYALNLAWLAALFAPLILLYFLKLKRPRMDVPSLALWRQVINDQRVNSPFQKFKRNILLLLQMLVLGLLVLAAMQPYLRAAPERAEFQPVLIDCSASMAALDGPNGRTRLDVAKEQIRELIDNLLPDQRLSLIAFHSSARRLTDFTDNKRVLHDALDKLETADLPSQTQEALRMAQALSRTNNIPRVLMYSDGNVPEEVDFELPFEFSYQKLPAGGKNIGITALNARRSSATGWDIFVLIEGTALEEASGSVEAIQGGTSIGRESVTIEPGSSRRLVFRVESENESIVEIRLTPEGFDSLASDNVAYVRIPQARPLSVLVPTQMASFRHALRGIKGVEVIDDASKAEGSRPDLQFSDRPSDAQVESPVSLFVGFVPDELKKLVTVETGSMNIVDWQRSEPLLQHVQFNDVTASDEPRSAQGIQDGDYEQLGYEVLAFGATGPLLLKKRDGGKLSYHLLIHTDHSTLPYRVAFPILVANAVQIALESAQLSEVQGERTGVLPPRTLRPKTTYTIRGPHGIQTELESNDAAVLSGVPAPLVGEYVVSEGSGEVARLGVGLLDARESTLVSVPEIQFREMKVAATEATLERDRPLWSPIALLGFCALLVEWWYFQRRPAAVSAR